MAVNDNTISATRRRPQQHRSRMLVASIREACLRILQEGRPEQLTAARIAELAGVTIGSFYQYYPNKEAVLLDVLLERAPGEAERIADETRHIQQLRRESLEATLAELIEVTCERHLRLLALHGEIYRRYHRVIDFHELVRASVARYVEVSIWESWMRVLLEEHRADIGAESVEIAAFLAAGTIVEMGARAVDTAPEWLGSPLFRAELLRMLMRYLGAGGDRPSST